MPFLEDSFVEGAGAGFTEGAGAERVCGISVSDNIRMRMVSYSKRAPGFGPVYDNGDGTLTGLDLWLNGMRRFHSRTVTFSVSWSGSSATIDANYGTPGLSYSWGSTASGSIVDTQAAGSLQPSTTGGKYPLWSFTEFDLGNVFNNERIVTSETWNVASETPTRFRDHEGIPDHWNGSRGGTFSQGSTYATYSETQPDLVSSGGGGGQIYWDGASSHTITVTESRTGEYDLAAATAAMASRLSAWDFTSAWAASTQGVITFSQWNWRDDGANRNISGIGTFTGAESVVNAAYVDAEPSYIGSGYGFDGNFVVGWRSQFRAIHTPVDYCVVEEVGPGTDGKYIIRVLVEHGVCDAGSTVDVPLGTIPGLGAQTYSSGRVQTVQSTVTVKFYTTASTYLATLTPGTFEVVTSW